MASVALECTMFGIFLILSSTSLLLLVRRRVFGSNAPPSIGSGSRGHRQVVSDWLSVLWVCARSPLIIANVLLMLTITAHWVIGIQRLFVGVVQKGGGQAATDYYNDLRSNSEVTRTALLFVDMLVGDVIITYRTWLVWHRNWRVLIFPGLTIATLIAFGIGLLHEFGNLSPHGSVFGTAVVIWITGYCAATLCTNLYGTSMIAYRIWSMNRLMKNNRMASGGRDLTSALAIFVESAALYSAWAIMFVVFYTTRSALQTIGSGCGPTITGIAFMLITVRVGLGWGQDSAPPSVSVSRARVRRRGVGEAESGFQMGTFTLDIGRTVERETVTDFAIPQRAEGKANTRGQSQEEAEADKRPEWEFGAP